MVVYLPTRWWQLNDFLLSSRSLGAVIQFDEHIFQMGWFNHQRVMNSTPWKFNSSPLKICKILKGKDIFQPSFFFGRAVKLRGCRGRIPNIESIICFKCLVAMATIRGKDTPLKFNMEPKNEALEDDFPFPSGLFQLPCYLFRWCFHECFILSVCQTETA